MLKVRQPLFHRGARARERRAHRVGGFLVLAISFVAFPLRADEDSAEDHGSRAVHKAESTSKDLPSAESSPAQPSTPPQGGNAEEQKKSVKGRSEREEDELSFGYTLGVFGGSHTQQNSFGLLANARLEAGFHHDDSSAALEFSYGYDPFSTKTFNFPEEEASDNEARLTQALHELATTLRLGHNFSAWLQGSLRARADWWLPEQPLDERQSLRLEPELRFGESRGFYASVATDGFYKRFPNYEVADRRLDQRGIDGTLEFGYSVSPYNRVAVGTSLDYTEYLDARYEVLTDSGALVRAERSKRYLTRAPFVFGSVRPAKQFRASARYTYELNDSIDYDRRMTGRIDGALTSKFIRDYYDYRRHRITINTVANPLRRLSFGTLSELWFRDFDSYEARDTNNNWTGQRRHDFNLELGIEASYRIGQFKAWGLDHGLFISTFSSHLHRRSNMKREVAIATNFDVTRLFVGFELHDF